MLLKDCIHILLKSYKHVTRNLDKNNEEKASGNIGYDDVVFLMLKEKFGPDSKYPRNLRFVASIVSEKYFFYKHFRPSINWF